MRISLKKKFFFIIGISTLFVVFLDIMVGNFMLEKIIEFEKTRNLNKIDFIVNKDTEVNRRRLEEYEEFNRAQTVVIKDGKIVNEFDFCFVEIESNGGKREIVFLGSMLNNRSFEVDDFISGNTIRFNGVKIIGNYYIPYSLELDGQEYIDDKLKYLYQKNENLLSKEKSISGKIITLNEFHNQKKESQNLDLSLQAKFLEVMASGKAKFNQIFSYDRRKVQILKVDKGDFIVYVFYEYERFSSIQHFIAKYNFFKFILAILIFIFTVITLKLLVISPIIYVTGSIKKLSEGEMIKIPKNSSNDEIGELFRSVEKLNSELNEVISMYKESTERNRNIFNIINEKSRIYMHEVRNPLSLIVGYSKIALEDFENNELEDMVENLEIIESAAKTLAILTNRDFTMKNNDIEYKIELSEFPIINLIQLVIRIVKVGKSKDIKIEFDYPEEEIIVLADRERIKQVVWNFLSNAIDYAENKILITLNLIGDEVKISIMNDGMPIPENDLGKIWNRYITKSEKGEGLGLYIVSRYLKQLNSNYGVKNIDGDDFNVEFYFYLKKSM